MRRAPRLTTGAVPTPRRNGLPPCVASSVAPWYHWLFVRSRRAVAVSDRFGCGAGGARSAPVAGKRMPGERESFVTGSLRHLQDNIRRAGPAATASYSLVGAILLLGGGGHLVDRWQGTEPWGLIAGLIAGLIVGFYELAKTVWKRD